MEYLNLPQIILIALVAITHVVGLFIFMLNVQPEDEGKMTFVAFCMWCIYMVLSFGVYFYLGQ